MNNVNEYGLKIEERKSIINRVMEQIDIYKIISNNDNESLSSSQYSQSSNDPFEIYHYPKKISMQPLQLQSQRLMQVKDAIQKQLQKSANLKSMSQLKQSLKEEEFILDRLLEIEENRLSMAKQIYNTVEQASIKISKDNQQFKKQSQNDKSKEFHNLSVQTSLMETRQSGTNYDVKKQKNHEQQHNFSFDNKTRILCHVPSYSVSIIHHHTNKEVLPISNEPKRQINDEQFYEPEKQIKKIPTISDKSIQPLQKLSLPLLPPSPNSQQLYIIYQELEQQMKYFKFLSRNKQKKQSIEQKRKIKEQKIRVQYCMQKYWKYASKMQITEMKLSREDNGKQNKHNNQKQLDSEKIYSYELKKDKKYKKIQGNSQKISNMKPRYSQILDTQ